MGCSCGSGIPVQTVSIEGRPVELLALPLIFSNFRERGREPDVVADELLANVEIYNARSCRHRKPLTGGDPPGVRRILAGRNAMSRTATYHTTVRWTGDHWGHIEMGNGPEMKFSAPPDAQGHAGVLTPEDAFVAAANTLRDDDVHLGDRALPSQTVVF